MKKKKRFRKIISFCLPAALFVGAVELMVCRYIDPELFESIVNHTTSYVKYAADTGKEWISCLSSSFNSVTQDSSEPNETDEIRQFAEDPESEDLPPAEDPVITEFITRNGQEILTGGVVDIVYYNQGEEPWASMTFGPDPIKEYGCGPTAMAMVVSSLTDQIIDPGKMAEWAYANGYCAPGNGSYLSIVSGTAKAYGLTCTQRKISSSEELLLGLSTGKLYVVLMHKGHFTNLGHFILLRGTTLEGKILVADPNSRDRCLTAWDPAIILEEAKPGFWEFSTT